MALQVKVVATQLDDLSSIYGLCMKVEGENRLPKVVLWLPHERSRACTWLLAACAPCIRQYKQKLEV